MTKHKEEERRDREDGDGWSDKKKGCLHQRKRKKNVSEMRRREQTFTRCAPLRPVNTGHGDQRGEERESHTVSQSILFM